MTEDKAVTPAPGAGPVTRLTITVYEGGEEKPARTVAIPLGFLKMARGLIPDKAMESLQKEGVDLNQLFEMAKNMERPATLLEVEDHKEGKKIAVTVE